jgi:glutamate-ammonia-ligase adenylyltransferase
MNALVALPQPAVPERLAAARARLAEAVGGLDRRSRARLGDALATEMGSRLLDALFGNSPYLTDLVVNDALGFAELIANGPERAVGAACDGLVTPSAVEPLDAAMIALRQAKRRAALAIAVADIGGSWSVERVTGAISELADATLSRAVRAALADVFGPDADPGGYVVLAMGKLGAGELNYSSDVDLIVLFDEAGAQRRLGSRLAGRSPLEAYLRVTRTLVRLMEERTVDGYVFRTDLRLRPDPASTPLCLSLAAAERYYGSTALTWERAAFIKARPVAGDRQAGVAFLDRISPFVWRRQLDFTAVAEIRDMRREIQAARGGEGLRARGHDVKLGRGGIREIEFLAQVQQLVWGGRAVDLRIRPTVPTLEALNRHGRLDDGATQELSDAYRFLRTVEHRLQMIDDQQTQTLPADAKPFAQFATFMGYPRTQAFVAALVAHLRRVGRHWDGFFAGPERLTPRGALRFPARANHPGSLARLAEMGFRDPPQVSARARDWLAGRHPATKSERARALAQRVVPHLVAAIGATADPDATFGRVDRFLQNLRGTVRIWALLDANHDRLRLVADVLGAAPALADRLEHHPGLLDTLVVEGPSTAVPDRADLAADLRPRLPPGDDVEAALDVVRVWVGERTLRLAVGMLAGGIDPIDAATGLSDLADAAIGALVPVIARHFEHRHGRVTEGRFVVLGLGKLGGRELTLGSDLDLVFVYDAATGADTSDGKHPLATSVYFNRLAQRLVSALTVPTGAGDLYQVDLRLRPSGNKGPAAIRFAGFVDYQTREAWTWEHMALTRARVVGGDRDLGRRVEANIAEVLARPRDPQKLLADVADMRRDIWTEHGNERPFDAKHRRGGLVDIEFMAQYLMLANGGAAAGAVGRGTEGMLVELGAAGILSEAQAAQLVAAHRLWRRVQHMLRLVSSAVPDPDETPPPIRRRLAELLGRIDFAEARQDIEAVARQVRTQFDSLIALPAQRVRRVAEPEEPIP